MRRKTMILTPLLSLSLGLSPVALAENSTVSSAPSENVSSNSTTVSSKTVPTASTTTTKVSLDGFVSEQDALKLSKVSKVFLEHTILKKDKGATSKEAVAALDTLATQDEKDSLMRLEDRIRSYQASKDLTKLNNEEQIVAKAFDKINEGKERTVPRINNGYNAGVVHIAPGKTIEEKDLVDVLAFDKKKGSNFEITKVSKVPTAKETKDMKVGKSGELLVDIDFVDSKGKQKSQAIQISYLISNDPTLKVIPTKDQVKATVAEKPVPVTTTQSTEPVSKKADLLPETSGFKASSLTALFITALVGFFVTMKMLFRKN